MSDQNIDQLRTTLKHLNARVEKLGRKVDELDIMAYRYKRLSFEINHIDVMAFEIRQEFDKVREIVERLRG